MSVLNIEKIKNSGFSIPAAKFYAVSVVLFALVSTSVHAEAVYRLKEGSETIYQDRAPSSSQDNGHSILNKQGVVLRRCSAAKNEK